MRRALSELHDSTSNTNIQTIDRAARLWLHLVASWLVVREGYDALVHGPEHAWLRHWSEVRLCSIQGSVLQLRPHMFIQPTQNQHTHTPNHISSRR
jgi:hypothetical protein